MSRFVPLTSPALPGDEVDLPPEEGASAEDALSVLDELTPEELEAMEELARLKAAQEEEQRHALGQVLVKHRNEAIRFRSGSGIERQWAEDQAYYEGEDESAQTLYYKGLTDNAPLIAKPKAKYRSKVFLNITRPYVETAASKVIEVLSPADEPMWSLDPSAVPNLPEKPSPLVMAIVPDQPPQEPQIDPATGQPMPAQPPAPPQPSPLEEAYKVAKAKAKGAGIWIEDKLSECQFPAQLRAVVDQSSLLGTGVMRGPLPYAKKTIKITPAEVEGGEDTVEVLEEISPASKQISVWDCFPDPACGDNIHNGQFFVEHDRMVEKQVRDLIDQPGYIQSAVLAALEAGPVQDSAAGFVAPPFESQDLTARRYHVWYYYGFLKREDVLAMQCSCDTADEIKNIGVPVVVTMINDYPVKAHLNPLSNGRFPYDFMCWQKVAGSPFGIGIARQIRSCQAILNAHVRAMMENAGLSSGPQIIIARGSVYPADGSWEITPRKVWILKADGDIQDVEKAMAAFQIPSMQAELLAAIDFALKMAENVTGLPILLQGQQGPNGVPETVGGMQILVANASSLLRRMARIFDDSLIVPHIQAYYTWLMLYCEDASIKGDFKVVAHGSSALVARDQRNAFITQIAPQMMANPSYGIDPTRLFKEIARISGVRHPEEIMFSVEEMRALQQNQQPDVKVQVAAINNQGKAQVAEMNNETAQLRVQRDIDRDTAYVAAETERTRVTSETKLAELQMRERLAMLEYANSNKLTLEELKAKLIIEGGRNDLARELATLPTTDDVAAGVAKSGDQIVPGQPEPAGRAPDGLGGAL